MRSGWLLSGILIAAITTMAVIAAYRFFYPGAVFILILLTCFFLLALTVFLILLLKSKSRRLLLPTIVLAAVFLYLVISGSMTLCHCWYWIHHNPDIYPDGAVVAGHVKGSVNVSPAVVERESRQTINLRIVCADKAVKTGGGFILRLGKIIPVGDEARFYDCFYQDMWTNTLQAGRPREQGFVSIANSGGAKFSLSKPPSPAYSFLVNTYARDLARYRLDPKTPIYFPLNSARKHEIHVKVTEGVILPGQAIDIVLGDVSQGSQGWTMPGGEADTDIVVYADTEGDGVFTMLDSFATLEVGGGAVSNLDVIAPSTPRLGENFTVSVLALDACGYVSMLHNGTAEVEVQAGVSIDSPTLHFYTHNRGVASFKVKINGPGTYRIRVKDMASGKTYASNPIWVREGAPPSLFWGDLHQHTTLGKDANRTPEWVFKHNIEIDRFDFSSISIHDLFDYWGLPPTDNEQQYLVSLSDRFNKTGEFVTLKGFEWTSFVQGHRNVYYAEGEQYGIVTHDAAGTPESLIRKLSGRKFMIIPHHTAWRFLNSDKPNNWGPPGCREMRLVEIYSKHGSSDFYEGIYPIHHDMVPYYFYLLGRTSNRAHRGDGSYVRDALAAGYRLGIIAGGDNHWARGGKGFGTGVTADYPAGIQAVYANSLTRTDIYDAMWKRHTYGTTGARIILDFNVDGSPMGSELGAPGGEIDIDFKVKGTSPVKRVELWRFSKSGGYKCDSYDGAGRFDMEHNIHVFGLTEDSFHFLHVIQEDGQLAWSSPIWIDVPRK